MDAYPVSEGRVTLCRGTVPRLPRDGPPLSSVGHPFPEERVPLFSEGRVYPLSEGRRRPFPEGRVPI